MKQYVLEPGPRSFAALQPSGPSDAPASPLAGPAGSRWRTVGLLLVIEPIALGVLYLVLVGSLGSSKETSAGPAAIVRPPSSTARTPIPTPVETPRVAEAVPVVSGGRVRPDRGRFAIDLRSVPPAEAVAMLAKATGATVTGEQIFVGSALRITHASVAPSAREAWQAVFGDVASFALACPRGVCEVRFVSLVQAAPPALPAPPLATAAPVPMPAPARMVEALEQGVSKPAPMPAPVPQGLAPAAPPPPAPASADDPNAAEN